MIEEIDIDDNLYYSKTDSVSNFDNRCPICPTNVRPLNAKLKCCKFIDVYVDENAGPYGDNALLLQ